MVKLKAATIIETTIAMVIIVSVFLIAISIFLNISKGGITEQKITAYETINLYINQLEIEDIPSAVSAEINGILIEADIQQYGEQKGLVSIYCRAYNNTHNLLAEQKRILKYK